MSWNYRVLQREDEDGYVSFAIHEIYYQDGVIVSWTKDAMLLTADNYDTLKYMKDIYMLAFDSPVLIEK